MPRNATLAAVGRLLAGCLAVACAPESSLPSEPDDVGSSGGSGEVDVPEAIAVPLRRLTRAQYEHAVRQSVPTLPAGLQFADRLPLDDRAGGYAANTTPVTDTMLEQYERAAEVIAGATAVDGLDSAGLEGLASSLYRRPLGDGELVELQGLLDAGGPQHVVRALLTSPDFLHRIESGRWLSPGLDRIRLDDHAIASRLAFVLWASPPDGELTEAAARGELGDPETRTAHLRRMLADPRARTGMAQMHLQWLELEPLSHLVKDRNVFANFSEAVGPQMQEEVGGFVDAVLRSDEPTLAMMLTSRRTYAQPGVTFWYGDDAKIELDEPPAGAPEQTRVLTLDAERRAGVLTLVSVLAAHAKPDQTNPVRRGAMIRARLLCQPLAAVPPDVSPPPAAPIPGASLREQLDQHRDDASCAVCHDLSDPIGFALESYDAMGRSRTADAEGNPIDDRGEVVQSDIAGAVQGGVALAESLASSAQVQRCYATQWFRYTFGREEGPDDAATLDALHDAFTESGGHIPTLLEALVSSDAFIHRRLP